MPKKLTFKVIHASGQDDNYRAAELNNHGPHCRGWESARFCLFPQDIVVQLDSRSRLRKIQLLSHQHLIATKIEFYVGDVPDGVPLNQTNARYTRLGYVSLSDNEKTGFKARELKSVHVDAAGCYLKLVIHKNHVNKLNLYNQVGIVAINIIGEKISKYSDSNYVDVFDNRNIDDDPAIKGYFNRPDYISPMDDLAFDMYQDPEIAQIIRRLEAKKQEAVLQERYDYAKRLKQAIDELQKESEARPQMDRQDILPPINLPELLAESETKTETSRKQSSSAREESTTELPPLEELDYSSALEFTEPWYTQYGPHGNTDLDLHGNVENDGYRPRSARRDSLPDINPQPKRASQPRVRHIHINTEELLQGVEDGVQPSLEIALEEDEVLNLSLDLNHHYMVGEKLGKMDVEKRQAVENEDYDKAKLKKVQIDEYRLQIYRDLNIPDLLELDGSRHPNPIDLEPVRQQTPPRLSPYHRSPRSPSPPRYDERPLPISHREPSPKAVPQNDLEQRPAYDDRPLPINKPSLPVEEEPEFEPDAAAGEPEPMTEKDIRDASSAIDVFGHPLVSKAYSKTWSYREDSLLAVYDDMHNFSQATHREDPKDKMRGAIFLVRKTIDDKVYAVFKAALNLLKMILTEFVPKHKIPRQETISAVERTIPGLLKKCGDTAIRNRDDTKKFIQDMSRFPEVKPTHVVPMECLRPFKPAIAPRLAESRVEIVESLYKDIGLEKNGMNVDNLMQFCMAALNHNAGEVREVSERIIRTLYKDKRDLRQQIKSYLPPDDEKVRKNTLWRQMFEYFDKVDGKPSKSDIKKQKAEEETKKQAEIDALQKQLQQLKDMASGKAPIDQNLMGKGGKKAPVSKLKAPLKSKPPPKASEDDDLSVANMEKICIFCNERNEGFDDEGLDMHYWKNCPMLKRCANCKQVVEIASLTDHLLGECEAHENFAKCPRCSEAILKDEYDQHVADKTCNPSKSTMNHCPLCHQNVSMGEDGWKNHLMGQNGCKQNPRRLLQKQTAPQSKLPAPRSRVPTKTNRVGRK